MARDNVSLYTFNRGRISRLGLARAEDLERTRLSAEKQTNWVPRTLGSMMLRPGLGYIDATPDNKSARMIPFIFSTTDTGLVVVTDTNMSVLVDDTYITRSNSTATISGGEFTSTSLAGWTDADETNSTSEWLSGNYMGLTGTRFNRAIRRQSVSASSGDHGLSVSVDRGRPIIKVGSSTGGDDYIEETPMRPGVYSFKVTSTGTFHVELSANTEYASRVSAVSIESSGRMTLDTPWSESDLGRLRWEQSGNVLFVSNYSRSSSAYKQRRIARTQEGAESWSVAEYDPEDGPFRIINTSNKKLSPSALTGNITLSSDSPTFKTGHEGALFKITSIGQQVEITVTDGDQFSDSIRVSGVTDSRQFDVLVSDHASASNTVRVQRSIGEEGSWADVSGLSWTSTIATNHNDGLDNQIVFYRIGSGSTDIGSTTDTITAQLTYASGGITGIARVVSVPSATESSAIVLKAFGSTAESELWSEGDWSTLRGFPSAVVLHEGRLVWAGKSKLWASISDAFESFDDETEGDSGPINLTVGKGPVDTIEWLISLTRLILGGQGSEKEAKTSSLEEPLTPTNFALRDIATLGSANVQAVQVDKSAYFVDRSGVRVYEVRTADNGLDLSAIDRTIVVPEVGEPGISRMAAQRQPDTRLHCPRSDGTVALLVTDPAENVLAWLDIETGDADGTNGVVEDVAVLPGTVEDDVYYLVKRMINGGTVRYVEKWAKESEARGGAANKQADSFIVQNSTATTTFSGLDHLVGETISVWGSTDDLGIYVVSSTGEVTGISQASTTMVGGLPYTATFKSAKLPYAASYGSALTQAKRIDHVSFILADTHARGIQYGPSTARLQGLPAMEDAKRVSTAAVWESYDAEPIPFDGNWETDARIVLVGQSPKPVTVLGAVLGIQTKVK